MLSVVSLGSWPLWLGFLAFVGAMLAIDLGVFHSKPHVVSLREAAAWSGCGSPWRASSPSGCSTSTARSGGSSSPPGTSSRRR